MLFMLSGTFLFQLQDLWSGRVTIQEQDLRMLIGVASFCSLFSRI